MYSDQESQVTVIDGPRFSKQVVVAVFAGVAVLFAPVAIHLAQLALLQQGDVESVQIEDEVCGAKLSAPSWTLLQRPRKIVLTTSVARPLAFLALRQEPTTRARNMGVRQGKTKATHMGAETGRIT